MLQKILIATGDSPESAEVFTSGLTLAEKYGAQISILHVLNLFQNGFEAVSNPFMGGSYPMMNDGNPTIPERTTRSRTAGNGTVRILCKRGYSKKY
ncbi:universal stress protein [Chamaesiphon sp. OTE_8_metabat_110]|uniref:universal stress protein n=1 Tax=Chamaesiphon sp. OTE_8_metabat_110 TaxID=2964696 RepID=UPI00286B3373|nr:universal stress protein [Chamaesiphon sp. OTE_8_metabat_110]